MAFIPDGLPESLTRLRHGAEWPAYVFAAAFAPALLILLGLLAPTYLFLVVAILFLLLLFREIFRRIVHANSVLLSRSQFPEIYETVDAFSRVLGLKRAPDVFVTNGQGVTNAFATETWGKAYIVLHSELFSDQGEAIQAGLRYIIGHELGHIRLKHTSIFYQIPLTPWMALSLIPIVGMVLSVPLNVLSRFREYSCDRVGAALAPEGVNGLLLLAAGRYVYERVDLETYLEQAQSKETRGRWTGIAELFSTHPFVSNRVRNLYRIGLWKSTEPPTTPQP